MTDQQLSITLLVIFLAGWALKLWQWHRHLNKRTCGVKACGFFDCPGCDACKRVAGGGSE
jgi:hypothetical protein